MTTLSPNLRGRARERASTLSYCLLVLFLGLPSRGLAEARAPSPQTSANAYLAAVQAAVDAYNEHRLADARASFERAHALKPSARTWHGLGLCSFELGLFEQAAVELQTALQDTRAPLVGDVRDEAVAMVRSAQQRRELASLEPAASSTQASEGADEESTSDAALPAPDVDDDEDARAPSWWTPRNITAVSVGAVGVVAVLVGVGFGVRSMREGNTRDRFCDEQGLCNDIAGVRAAERALTAGRVSTIGWALGGAALVGAGIVWWTGRGSRREASSARLSLGPGALKLHASW